MAPIAAPAAIGPMAIAWNHLQVQLIEHLGLEGLSLARQLAMTTYRSETDFAERFGGSVEDDGRPSVVSYLDHQGDKLVDRFDPATYRVLVGAMDGHDIARTHGGLVGALHSLGRAGVGLTGIGIEGDILYGPRQVQELVEAASAAGRHGSLPRDPVDQGPRRLPGGVGPADRCCSRRRWQTDPGRRGAGQPGG